MDLRSLLRLPRRTGPAAGGEIGKTAATDEPQEQWSSPWDSDDAWRAYMTQDEPRSATVRAAEGADRRKRIITLAVCLVAALAGVGAWSADTWAVDRVCNVISVLAPDPNGVKTDVSTAGTTADYNFLAASRELKQMSSTLVIHPHVRKAVRDVAGDVQAFQELQTMMGRGFSHAGDLDTAVALIARTDGHVRTAQSACSLPVRGIISASDRTAIENLKSQINTPVPVRPSASAPAESDPSATAAPESSAPENAAPDGGTGPQPDAGAIPGGAAAGPMTGGPGSATTSPAASATTSPAPGRTAGATPQSTTHPEGDAVVDPAAIALAQQQLSEDTKAYQETLADPTVTDIERQLARFNVEADLAQLAQLRAGRSGTLPLAMRVRGLQLQLREAQENYERVMVDPAASDADRDAMAAIVADIKAQLRALQK